MIIGIVGSGLPNPGGRFGIRDGFAVSGDVLAIPLHVDADPDYARVVAVPLHYQINQHRHIAARRLDLQPHLNVILIKGRKARLEQVRVVEHDVRPRGSRGWVRKVRPTVAPAPTPQHFDYDSHLLPSRAGEA